MRGLRRKGLPRGMKKALAVVALVSLHATAASASPIRDDRYFVAWASALDVTRAVRCAPPLGCRRPHKRYRRAYAQKRSLVRRNAHVPVHARERVENRASAAAASPAMAPAVIGGRPAGCPHRFCGCALALKIFGRIVPKLNLAANWLGFPRTAPAPGMVAARRGHVFQLLAHSGGSRWRVWDANSGHGRIRVHDRSIAGYAIVDPGGSVMSARSYARRR